jgi:hypothetical protein
MRTVSEMAKERRSTSCNCMVLNGVVGSEDVANRLLRPMVGRDPKTELKEPTKRR